MAALHFGAAKSAANMLEGEPDSAPHPTAADLVGTRFQHINVERVCPAQMRSPAMSSQGLTVWPLCSGSSARDNPQTSSRGWLPPVRLRYTRNTGRAQWRDTSAAAGSSAFSTRIPREPNHRKRFQLTPFVDPCQGVPHIASAFRRLVAAYLTQVNERPLLGRSEPPTALNRAAAT